MTATFSLQDARYQTPAIASNQFFDAYARAACAQIPGVEHAAAALTLPYERALNNGVRASSAAKPAPRIRSTMTYVTPEYFETLRIPVDARARRSPTADTASAAPVIVVNQAFVRRSFAGSRIRSAVRSPSGGVVAHDRRHRRRHSAEGRLRQLRTGRADAGRLRSGGADLERLLHAWCTPGFLRAGSCALRAPQPGIAAEMQTCRRSGRSAAAVREVPHARRRARRSGRDAARAGRSCSARSPRSRCCSRRSVSTASSPAPLPNGRASSASGSRSGAIVAAGDRGGRDARIASSAVVGVGIGSLAARLAATTMRHLVWGVSVNDPLTFAARGGRRVRGRGRRDARSGAADRALNPIRALRSA